MEKKQFKKKITFSLGNKISLFVLKGNNYIGFDLENSGQKFVKIPAYINSVYSIKKEFELYLTTCVENLRKLEKFASFLLNYYKNFERPFRKKLIMRGLGFKVNLTENNKSLKLKLGFSHSIDLRIPKEVSIKINKQSINLEGFNKTSVGNFANKIRKLRLPDSYKGKGVWYKNEVRVLKELKKK
jgi:hypothetical protein